MTFGPHGVYSSSIFGSIHSHHQFSQLFPGLDVLAITLPVNFWFPIWREMLLSINIATSSASSIRRRIKEGPPGTVMQITVGGGEELKYMEPGTLDLVMKKRKGFVRLALETGCDIIPALSLGENDLYTPIRWKSLKAILDKIFYTLFRASFPLIAGRWGTLVPYRKPCFVVVGQPLAVAKVANPTKDQVNLVHAQYLKHVQDLYDEYKDIFHKDRVRDMRFVA
ncbi:diacylglycerol O-acyltransferase 1 [Kappamyces sp. JEL0680]|nr:diacylglycerol O-acyltransferase 1 [Kappamyces sp. JEL0680]